MSASGLSSNRGSRHTITVAIPAPSGPNDRAHQTACQAAFNRSAMRSGRLPAEVLGQARDETSEVMIALLLGVRRTGHEQQDDADDPAPRPEATGEPERRRNDQKDHCHA